MSKNASNPVRQLRYTNNDAAVGVQHMHDLGVRYLMVTTHEAVAEADQQPDLNKIATSGPWHIYEYDWADDDPIVAPLDVQPVVVNGRDGDPRECFLEVGTSWFQHPDEWAAMPAVDGPDTWQRIDVAIDEARQEPAGQGTDGCGDPQSSTSRRVNIVQPAQEIEVVELPELELSNVDIEQQSVEFDVSEPGVPVLVRVSYFPNWTAHGAEGPYRIGPNQMVVIPTDTHVRLAYERSGSDLFFYGLTIVGIALAIFARVRGNWNFPKLAPATPAGEPLPPPPPTSVASSSMPPIAAIGPPPPTGPPLAPALPPPSHSAEEGDGDGIT
jgi:hypothetical protein